MVSDFLIVFLTTVLITFLVYWGIGGERRPGSLLLLFLSLLLGTWAGGLWIMPFLQSVSGLYWTSFIFVSVFYAAVVYLFLWPYKRPTTRGEAVRRTRVLNESERLLKVTLTVILVVSLAYVVFRYAG